MSRNYSTIAYGLLNKVDIYSKTRDAYKDITDPEVRVICEDQIMEQYAGIYGEVKSFSKEDRSAIIDAASHTIDSINKDIRDYTPAYVNYLALKDFVSVVNTDEQSAANLGLDDGMDCDN